MNAVSNMLPNLDIFGAKRDMTKKDVEIRLFKADDDKQEVKYIWEKASEAVSNGYSTVVLLPKHDDIIRFTNTLLENNNKKTWSLGKNRWGKPDYDSLNQYLNTQSLKAEYVGNGYGSFESAARNHNVIIMTYHSSKGMDFENVFLPFMSSDLYITSYQEETLFMVALTRSKTNLYISYSGQLHQLVKRFESSCQKVSFTEDNNKNDSFNFDF
jgi:superfamily I DNA/RNA helicase